MVSGIFNKNNPALLSAWSGLLVQIHCQCYKIAYCTIIRVRDERIMLAPGRVIGRGLLVTCGLSLFAARSSERAFHIQLDLLNTFIHVQTNGEVVLLACGAKMPPRGQQPKSPTWRLEMEEASGGQKVTLY